jgi:hypothetical protein
MLRASGLADRVCDLYSRCAHERPGYIQGLFERDDRLAGVIFNRAAALRPTLGSCSRSLQGRVHIDSNDVHAAIGSLDVGDDEPCVAPADDNAP